MLLMGEYHWTPTFKGLKKIRILLRYSTSRSSRILHQDTVTFRSGEAEPKTQLQNWEELVTPTSTLTLSPGSTLRVKWRTELLGSKDELCFQLFDDAGFNYPLRPNHNQLWTRKNQSSYCLNAQKGIFNWLVPIRSRGIDLPAGTYHLGVSQFIPGGIIKTFRETNTITINSNNRSTSKSTESTKIESKKTKNRRFPSLTNRSIRAQTQRSVRQSNLYKKRFGITKPTTTNTTKNRKYSSLYERLIRLRSKNDE